METWHVNLIVALIVIWVYMYLTAGEDKKNSVTKLFGDCGCGCGGKVTEIHALKAVIVALTVYLILLFTPRNPLAGAAAVLAAYFIFHAINTR